MADDYNSIINGMDDYTNRIVSSKSEADMMSEGRYKNKQGVDLAESLEIYNRADQNIHPNEGILDANRYKDNDADYSIDYNIPDATKGKDPY